MKTIILTAALIVFGVNTSSAQKIKEIDVPKEVVSSFQSRFKEAKAKEWEKEGDKYEVEFDWNKVETSACYSKDGNLMEIEHEIKVSELPKTVADYVTTNYAGYKITEASKIEDAATKKISYEAEIQNGKEEMDLMFDVDGNFLSKEALHDGDKDEKK